MYLIDTNIWLERLLDQDKSKDVGNLLGRVPSEQLFITDFTFHSICLILCKLQKRDALKQFVRDAFVDGSVSLIHLAPRHIDGVISVMRKYSLDFDDAYQYSAAEQYGLTIISFDSDFDRTDNGRKTPEQAIKIKK